MNTPKQSPPTYHILLIGIDAYTIKPLHGCVNDIDAIQGLLLGERVGVPQANFTRLASPHPDTPHTPLPGEKSATLANIRAALAKLGAKPYTGDHRVLIYYSGHGTRAAVTTPAGIFHREALVPVDFNAEPDAWKLLFDFEFNKLLADIAARGASVTVILDCCNSSGITREVPGTDMTSRVIDFVHDLKHSEALPLPAAMAERAAEGVRGVAGNVDDCHVIAACLSHELAQESTSNGVRHGLLTRALVDQLRAVPAGEDLRAVPWARIWQALRADVDAANPTQHVWMAGDTARAVLAGPRVDGDRGIAVQRTGANTYTLDAGALAAVTEGSKIAVYDVKPPSFPPLGSEQDRKARFTDILLEVTEATAATATAKALGAPFDPPPGARGRLVKPGTPGRLRCAVVPPDPEIVAALASSPLLSVVDEAHADALLRWRGDTKVWELTDDIHGASPNPPLARLQSGQRDRAAPVLEQYFFYALPLRMATACKDLSGKLRLSLLRCPKGRDLTEAEMDGVGLPEVAAGSGFTYDLKDGDKVAFQIRNTASERLKVSLLNAAASGRVEYLGDAVLDSGAMILFWHKNTRGKPFPTSAPQGAEQGIDRLVAIGTTAFDKDLRYLKVDSKFVEIVDNTRRLTRDFDDETASPPPEQWTATQVVTRCQR